MSVLLDLFEVARQSPYHVPSYRGSGTDVYALVSLGQAWWLGSTRRHKFPVILHSLPA